MSTTNQPADSTELKPPSEVWIDTTPHLLRNLYARGHGDFQLEKVDGDHVRYARQPLAPTFAGGLHEQVAQQIVDIALRDNMQCPHRDTITTLLRENFIPKPVPTDGEICKSCNLPVAYTAVTWWQADDALWNRVEGQDGPRRCIPCFTKDCQEKGVGIYWQAVLEASPPAPMATDGLTKLITDHVNDLRNAADRLRNTNVEAFRAQARAILAKAEEWDAALVSPMATRDEDFNPDRLITKPRTLGDVYARENRSALITECCGMAIGPDCRFCPKCGQEARVEVGAKSAPATALPPQTLYEECEAAWLPYRESARFYSGEPNVRRVDFQEGYVAGRADQSKLFVERTDAALPQGEPKETK